MGVPWPKKVGPPGVHFWECGLRGFSPARIRRALRQAGFSKIRTVKLPTNYSSIFFELEK
ncbi:MAG: hypothetical protein ACRDOE_20660, partial [Streptosporangiaceae bacterium]